MAEKEFFNILSAGRLKRSKPSASPEKLNVIGSKLITRDVISGNYFVTLPSRGETIIVASLPSARVLAEAESVRATVASRIKS
ncbi:hypothetical protein [Arthrobacter sp. CAN_A1]|uniref:hypothetical protein n=1 Tax=Arthrobacter sp. CAN_A1 TaxID=2787717 RepID=UPI0018C97129